MCRKSLPIAFQIPSPRVEMTANERGDFDQFENTFLDKMMNGIPIKPTEKFFFPFEIFEEKFFEKPKI